MKSACAALVWEIWWKNRWAFAVLALLFVMCEAISLYTSSLEHRAEQLRTQFRALSQGNVAVSQVLREATAEGEAAEATVKLGAYVLYKGPLAPQDVLSWSGDMAGGVVPVVQAALNGHELSVPQALPAQLSVSVMGVRQWTRLLNNGFETGEQASQVLQRARGWQESGLTWSMMVMAFSLLLLFAVFASAEPHSVRGFTGLPARRFTLPVRTGTLVLWPVGAGAAVVLLLSVIWSKVVLPPLLPDPVQIPTLYFAVLLVTGLAVFQALVWGLPSFPKTRVWLITVAILVLFGMAMLPFDGAGAASSHWNEWQWRIVPVLAGVWVCAVAASWLGVRWERRGRWSGWIRSARIAGWLRALHPPSPPFPSPLQAQLWLEWRRNGRVALTIWTVLVWVALGFDLLARNTHPEWQGSVLGWFAWLGAAGWLAVSGLNLARDGAGRRLPMSSFTAVRPLPTGALLEAKLITGGLLWVGAVLILGASWFVCGLSAGYLANLGDIFSSTAAVAVLVISAHLFVGILPFCLWGRMPGFPWSLLPWLLVYGFILNGIIWFGQHQQYLPALFWLLIILVVLKLVVALWAFRRSLALRLSSIGFVSSYVAFWLVISGFLLWATWEAVDRHQWPMQLAVLLPAVLLIVPLARIGLSPLLLASNRHR